MDPRFDGYVEELEARFDEADGYDAERARTLLAEAGYPDAFPDPVVRIAATALGGSPEFGLMAELVQSLFAEIGLQTEIREIDWPTLQNARLGFEADFVHPMRNAPVRPNAIGVLASHAKQLSPAYSIGSADLDAMGDELLDAKEPAARAALVEQMFTYVFDNYAHMPVATVSAEIAVNPNSIDGWQFPGASSSGFSHFQLIDTVELPEDLPGRDPPRSGRSRSAHGQVPLHPYDRGAGCTLGHHPDCLRPNPFLGQPGRGAPARRCVAGADRLPHPQAGPRSADPHPVPEIHRQRPAGRFRHLDEMAGRGRHGGRARPTADHAASRRRGDAIQHDRGHSAGRHVRGSQGAAH
jgi:hypothetical protein